MALGWAPREIDGRRGPLPAGPSARRHWPPAASVACRPPQPCMAAWRPSARRRRPGDPHLHHGGPDSVSRGQQGRRRGGQPHGVWRGSRGSRRDTGECALGEKRAMLAPARARGPHGPRPAPPQQAHARPGLELQISGPKPTPEPLRAPMATNCVCRGRAVRVQAGLSCRRPAGWRRAARPLAALRCPACMPRPHLAPAVPPPFGMHAKWLQFGQGSNTSEF